MTLPEIIIWLVVAAVGVPSAWRNPTAAALVLSWFAGQAFYLLSGDNLPLQFYLFPDIVVLAVIFAKPEWCNLQPYRSVWHQLWCVVMERSPADRVVMLIYPLMWAIYVSPMDPFHKWWSLWGLVIAQFMSVGTEAFTSTRRDADAADRPDLPGLQLVASRSRGYG